MYSHIYKAKQITQIRRMGRISLAKSVNFSFDLTMCVYKAREFRTSARLFHWLIMTCENTPLSSESVIGSI